MKQETIKKIINGLIILMVVVGLGLGVFYTLGRNTGDDTTQDNNTNTPVQTNTPAAQTASLSGISPEATQLIRLLDRLDRIELDHSVVERSDFNALTNIMIAIPPESVGTSQPFDAL